MRYISYEELRIIAKACDRIAMDRFDEQYQQQAEMAIGDTLDSIVVDGVKTLKYSNVLLIGIQPVGEEE
jgi:hypothetical protein